MPLVEFAAGTHDRCYRCMEPGDPKLLICSRCRIARYCSPECQKADWKKHRDNCINHKQNYKEHGDPAMKQKVRDFQEWHDVWRDGICAWGTFNADLANQSTGYLLNHTYLVEIEPLSNKQSPASRFRVKSGGMLPDTQIQEQFDRVPDQGYRAQLGEQYARFVPNPDLLRIVVVCYPLYSASANYVTNIFPDGQATSFIDPSRPESRLLSAALAQTWRKQFDKHVRNGNVKGHQEILQKLIQEIHDQCSPEVD
ncbi:MYND-type domain-containing protein [Favolaschia claudopus]|uniref:MYND-type domain-containing protein n=1 Tax=Favolaschia claudopus TaxID=2862362 RepID=A0AAW0EAB2_9AGAR